MTTPNPTCPTCGGDKDYGYKSKSGMRIIDKRCWDDKFHTGTLPATPDKNSTGTKQGGGLLDNDTPATPKEQEIAMGLYGLAKRRHAATTPATAEGILTEKQLNEAMAEVQAHKCSICGEPGHEGFCFMNAAPREQEGESE